MAIGYWGMRRGAGEAGPALGDILLSAEANAKRRMQDILGIVDYVGAKDKEKKVQFAREAYAKGVPRLLQERAPDEFLKLEGGKLEREQFQDRIAQAQQQRQAKATQEREMRSARFWANPEVQARQNDPGFQQYAQHLVEAGKINPLDAAPGAAQAQAAMHGIELPKPDKPQMTPDMLEYERAQQDPAFAKYMRNKPRGGVNINLGNKPLPVEAVTSMADFEAASAELGNLWQSYQTIAPTNAIEAATARARAKIPGTAEWQFLKEAESVAQGYGLVREGGKLQASDFPRYLEQMPMPWDMPDSAKRKYDVAGRAMAGQQGARREQLGGAGYRVPKQQQVPTDAEIDAELAEIEGAP